MSVTTKTYSDFQPILSSNVITFTANPKGLGANGMGKSDFFMVYVHEILKNNQGVVLCPLSARNRNCFTNVKKMLEEKKIALLKTEKNALCLTVHSIYGKSTQKNTPIYLKENENSQDLIPLGKNENPYIIREENYYRFNGTYLYFLQCVQPDKKKASITAGIKRAFCPIETYAENPHGLDSNYDLSDKDALSEYGITDNKDGLSENKDSLSGYCRVYIDKDGVPTIYRDALSENKDAPSDYYHTYIDKNGVPTYKDALSENKYAPSDYYHAYIDKNGVLTVYTDGPTGYCRFYIDKKNGVITAYKGALSNCYLVYIDKIKKKKTEVILLPFSIGNQDCYRRGEKIRKEKKLAILRREFGELSLTVNSKFGNLDYSLISLKPTKKSKDVPIFLGLNKIARVSSGEKYQRIERLYENFLRACSTSFYPV